jgi:hypothetical protein
MTGLKCGHSILEFETIGKDEFFFRHFCLDSQLI